MIASSGVLLAYDIDYTVSGSYFSSIYYGTAPELITLSVLSGTSNNFSHIELQTGTTWSGGSLLLGSTSSGGGLQTFDFSTRTVIDYHSDDLETRNVEDFS